MTEQAHRKEPQVPEMAAAAVIPEDPDQAQAPEPVDKKAHVSKTTSEGAKLMNFLKGIKPSTFLSTHEEWHAFVEGLCEVLCPWPAKYQLSGKLLNELREDHHYYVFGRALGVIAWLIIAKIIQEAFW